MSEMTQREAVRRAWRHAEKAEDASWQIARNAFGENGIPSPDRLVEIANMWAAVAAQLPFEPLAPGEVFETGTRDHELHVSDGTFVPWCAQCRFAATGSTDPLLVPRVEPGQGGDPGVWCHCGRPGYAEPHAMTDGCPT